MDREEKMNWLNLRTSWLREPEFIGAEPSARAAWLCVLSYCCEMENGGRIAGARAWKDRQWQQTCGVTLEEVESASTLISWDGDDLVIWRYPEEKQAEVEAKREAGRQGGLSSGEARRKHSFKQNGSTASSTSEASLERKEKEKEKEKGIGKEVPPKAPQDAAASPPLGAGKEKDVIPKSPEALAICELFNRKPSTEWDSKLVRKFKDGVRRGVITLSSIHRISDYYAAERGKGEEGRHRRDIGTFLNNFDGEIDRAEAFLSNGNGHHVEVPRGEFAKPFNAPPTKPQWIVDLEAAKAAKANGA